MTRIPIVAAAAVTLWCGEPPDNTASPTAPLEETSTPTAMGTPIPTPTEPPPTQPGECPPPLPIPYCELHPEDC